MDVLMLAATLTLSRDSSPGVSSREDGSTNISYGKVLSPVFSFSDSFGSGVFTSSNSITTDKLSHLTSRRKRPRRKFTEIQRLYTCNFENCDKAYGTLHHLNTHVQIHNHGPKRMSHEFHQIRREMKPSKNEKTYRMLKQSDNEMELFEDQANQYQQINLNSQTFSFR